MGRSQVAFPRFGIRLRSPPPRVNHISYIVKPATPESKDPPRIPSGDWPEDRGSAAAGNRVMVVVDSSLEAEGALEWALSHTVQNHRDCIVLLQVVKPFGREHGGKFSLRADELLRSMRTICKSRMPSLKVEVVTVEGENKGPVIVEEAKRQRVSLLVLGRRRRLLPTVWRLVWQRLPGNGRRKLGMVEYCIQNASCMVIAVRRKCRKLGGYSITTKRHKNFWLLA